PPRRAEDRAPADDGMVCTSGKRTLRALSARRRALTITCWPRAQRWFLRVGRERGADRRAPLLDHAAVLLRLQKPGHERLALGVEPSECVADADVGAAARRGATVHVHQTHAGPVRQA